MINIKSCKTETAKKMRKISTANGPVINDFLFQIFSIIYFLSSKMELNFDILQLKSYNRQWFWSIHFELNFLAMITGEGVSKHFTFVFVDFY